MVISRTPLRISIAGGGTDLPAWYKDHGSMFISAAINKYIYTTVHHSKFDPSIRVRYSKMEQVSTVDEVQNDIVRETLKACGITDSIEITSHADIPSGTGLGSSGAFGVGLFHAITLERDRMRLAGMASDVQIRRLTYPVGLQDQYATAIGGISKFELRTNREEIECERYYSWVFESKLALFYTGIKRDANEVLKQSSFDGLELVQDLAYSTKACLESQNYDEYGEILKEHWEAKKRRGGMTTPEIDDMHSLALKNGAIGGKIVGAGGGGFLLFYTNDREKLVSAMPLQHVPFKFDYEGSKIIYNDENLS